MSEEPQDPPAPVEFDQAELEAFTVAIQQGRPAPIPYRHLFGVTRASFAAVRALRTRSIQHL